MPKYFTCTNIVYTFGQIQVYENNDSYCELSNIDHIYDRPTLPITPKSGILCELRHPNRVLSKHSNLKVSNVSLVSPKRPDPGHIVLCIWSCQYSRILQYGYARSDRQHSFLRSKRGMCSINNLEMRGQFGHYYIW
eukprot:sb/3474610/